MKIRYGASMTVPHPTIPYANVKPTLEVEMECDDDKEVVLARLKDFVHQSLHEAVIELQNVVANR